MKLDAILNPVRVVSGLTVTSKKKAVEELSALLAQGAGGVTAADIFNSDGAPPAK